MLLRLFYDFSLSVCNLTPDPFEVSLVYFIYEADVPIDFRYINELYP